MNGEGFAYFAWYVRMPERYALALFGVGDKTRAAHAMWLTLQREAKL